jgi:hypothetical protein
MSSNIDTSPTTTKHTGDSRLEVYADSDRRARNPANERFRVEPSALRKELIRIGLTNPAGEPNRKALAALIGRRVGNVKRWLQPTGPKMADRDIATFLQMWQRVIQAVESGEVEEPITATDCEHIAAKYLENVRKEVSNGTKLIGKTYAETIRHARMS